MELTLNVMLKWINITLTSNIKLISAFTSFCSYSPLADAFSCQFRGHNLPSMLSKFSLPVSLSEFKNPLAPPVQEVRWGSMQELFGQRMVALLRRKRTGDASGVPG